MAGPWPVQPGTPQGASDRAGPSRGTLEVSRPRLPLLPVEPLRAECERQGTTIRQLGLSLGYAPGNRAHRGEGVAWPTADRLAVGLGVHPSAIWGDAWFAIARAYDSHVPDTEERRRRHNERQNTRRRDKRQAPA